MGKINIKSIAKNSKNSIVRYFVAEDVKKVEADKRYLTRLEQSLSNSSIQDPSYNFCPAMLEQRIFRALPGAFLFLTPLAWNLSSSIFPDVKAGYFSLGAALVSATMGIINYNQNRRQSEYYQSEIRKISSLR